MLCIFAIWKIIQILGKIFLIQFLYIFGKKMFLLKNTGRKCVIMKIILFFDVMKNGKNLSFKSLSIFSVITDCFLTRKWGTLEHARRDIWILDCRILLLLAFFKLLENKASIRKSFSFPFLQIVLIKTSKVYLKKI